MDDSEGKWSMCLLHVQRNNFFSIKISFGSYSMSCSKEKKDDEKRREEEGRRRKQKKKEERERRKEEDKEKR